MRALRNPLIGGIVLAALHLAACTTGAFATQLSVGGLPAGADGNAYFPLAAGNSWTYRCTVEGASPSGKTLTLGTATIVDGISYYRSELLVQGSGSKPLVTYLSGDAERNVYSSMEPNTQGRKLLISGAPKIGDTVGEWRVAAEESLPIPGLPRLKALRLENFSMDDPAVTSQKSLEWLGRFYARGVGPVSEADGLGGECTLSKFRIVKKPA